MIDIVREIEAVQREVGEGRIPAGDGQRRSACSATYDAPIEDVWDALDGPRADRPLVPADQRRLPARRSLPVRGQRGRRDRRVRPAEPAQGDLGVRRGERPGRRLGGRGPAVRRPATARRRLELEHTAVVPDEMWDQYGPGAVGVGWDRGLLGLALHLRGGSVGDPIAWQVSAEGLDFATRSSEALGRGEPAAGADPEAVARSVANTTAFYTTGPEPAAAT